MDLYEVIVNDGTVASGYREESSRWDKDDARKRIVQYLEDSGRDARELAPTVSQLCVFDEGLYRVLYTASSSPVRAALLLSECPMSDVDERDAFMSTNMMIAIAFIESGRYIDAASLADRIDYQIHAWKDWEISHPGEKVIIEQENRVIGGDDYFVDFFKVLIASSRHTTQDQVIAIASLKYITHDGEVYDFLDELALSPRKLPASVLGDMLRANREDIDMCLLMSTRELTGSTLRVLKERATPAVQDVMWARERRIDPPARFTTWLANRGIVVP